MGKKGYNWKARHTPAVEIDDSSTNKISVEIDHRQDNYDKCNPLVLPSEKRKTKNKDKRTTNVRLLSKKRRKLLEKVVEKKQKKLQRAELLDDLSKVQAPPEEIKQYVSLTTVQTKGLKRYIKECNAPDYKPKDTEINDDNDETPEVINAIKGSKRMRLAILEKSKEKGPDDPNIVGFETSSESELSDSDDEEIDEKPEIPESKQKPEEKKEIIVEKPKMPTEVTQSLSTSSKRKEKLGITEKDRKPAVFVAVDRKPEIQEARLKLPVLAEEQTIVEAINEYPVVIITGETGSGKTTQVPQFLYEAGYANTRMIGVTEPRRVAAMSMSKRVAKEMNLSENVISYLIRFEGNTTADTKMKFMTDGVLLKEIQTDFLLSKYSVIILDEAHERSVYTDILIGLLSRIVPLREKRKDPLKLIVMSATLRVEDFVGNPRLFKIRPPVIKVESRQFPVTIHFNRRTSSNYVLDSIKKAVKIHTRLPDGGILIFLTGQHEVNTVVRRLRKAFPRRNRKFEATVKKPEVEEETSDPEDSEEEFNARTALRRMKDKRKGKKELELPKIDLDKYSAMPEDDTHEDFFDQEDEEDLDENLDEEEDEDEDILELKSTSGNSQALWVLPLYSLLPGHKQAKVFDPVPEGCRLCVVSTNVAETSLTIPNVKYVIDSGRCKTRLYDKVTGVSTYKVCYSSKAGANQRAGRAGRTGPGHCYRLYSSAVFNDQFEEFSEPEIRRKPVDDLLLQMKLMNIHKVVNFPFPTAPDHLQLKSGEKRLKILGALEETGSEDYSAKITALGRSIAAFPVAPRYGKMLAVSLQQDHFLEYTICMVAALSVQEVLVEASPGSVGENNSGKSKWLQTRRFWAGTGNNFLLGDPMVLIRAVGAAEYAGVRGKLPNFCLEHGLREKAITEIRKLRQQLTNEIILNIPGLNLTIRPEMQPPTDREAKLLRQIILAGMGDQVAKKVTEEDVKDDETQKGKWKYAYRSLELEESIFMHSSCVLRRSCPEWVVYQEIYETNKIYMRGVTAIEPQWLPKFVPELCKIGSPVDGLAPRYDSTSGKIMANFSVTFGPQKWELPVMELEHPTNKDGVRLFAKFLLDGEIFPKLKRFVPSLLSTPSSINAFWAKLLPRTEILLKTLLSRGVMSRDKLVEIWKEDKTYLLDAYKKWLPESAQSELALNWPPVD